MVYIILIIGLVLINIFIVSELKGLDNRVNQLEHNESD